MANDLQKRVDRARAHADELAAQAAEARETAREVARDATALEAELDLELWVAAQVELGHPRDTLDLEKRLVTTLPIGPTYDL